MNSSSKPQRKSDPTSVRFGQRLPLEVPVELGIDGRTLEPGIIRNASISGAFIETALDLPLNTNVLVRFSMPDSDTRADHSLSACIVRIDAFGVGIEWRDMASVDITDLLARASKAGTTG